MCFRAWHRVCSTETIAPSVTEVLATHGSCYGDGGNIPLSYSHERKKNNSMNIEQFKLDTDNPEFQTALELIKNTNQSFFLTGKAGTGKSTFLKYIIDNVSKNFVVVAPTGIAAVNVKGMTIHSFFQFPLRPLLPEDEDLKVFWKYSEKRKIIKNMDTLIIDEISMVRADIIDGIDYSLRKNGGNPNLPFGGKQVVFVGDIFQLEPVTKKSSGEYKIVKEFYRSTYFYHAIIFNQIKLVSIELQKVYRQKDLEFIRLLDKVRTKEIGNEDITKLNKRVFTETQLKNKEFTITLTTTNKLADNVNIIKLSEIDTPTITYYAQVSGKYEESKYPTEPELDLKKGAQVIFIKNDTDKRWVNGTIGQITDLSEEEIKVKLENGNIHIVEKRMWENIKYHYNKEKKKIEQEIVGTFEQYPLKLAWAITIHKSQGLTFESVVIDFGTGTFASGQAYVALSRATEFEGLFLKQRMRNSDVYIDQELVEFSKSFNDSESINETIKFGKAAFRYLKNNDLEGLGYFYFENAVLLWIQGDFKLTVKNILIGFKHVSCDCELRALIEEKGKEIITSMRSNVINCTSQNFDFLRAIYYFFSDQEIKALAFIDTYLEDNVNSEIGIYLKGRTLCAVGRYEEGMKYLNNALELNDNARLNYRIGRIKEQKLDNFGIDHLFKSIMQNPSSSCAHSWFKEIADERNIKLETNTNKFLANTFNNKDSRQFKLAVDTLLFKGQVNLANNTVLTSSQALDDFLDTLKSDQNLFGYNDKSEEYQDEYYDDDYSPSYDKYNGAYGLDDNSIDSAFDGDPENYWNID